MIAHVNGIDLYYEKAGFGPPLVLLHGNGQSHRLYQKAAKLLSAEHTVYLPDSRDHGLSARVKKLRYEDMAADTADFLDTVIGEKTTVFGFSDGGIVALLLAINCPKFLSRVIVGGANTSPQGLKKFVRRLLQLFSKLERGSKKKLQLSAPSITAEMLQSIRLPVHVIAGEYDLVRESNTRFIAENIPDATLLILPHETHSSYVRQSKKLCLLLKKYI